ncbi:MAG: FeoA family protein [Verrucomicrobia bacterium]|nr:FeoA family protein [Verrucomicrobiota bacterium]
MSAATAIGLDTLKPDQYAVVEAIDAADDDMQRLMTMGVCPGRLIQLVMAGDPLILKVYGSRIGVSARLANRIMVSPGLPTAPVNP